MRIPLIVITLLLSACSDRDVQKLESIALNEGSKLLAKLEKQSGTFSEEDIAKPQSNTGEKELVSGKSVVGHRNFANAKKVLPHIFTGPLQKDIYCGCDYSGKDIDLASCGYVPRKNANRASRLEWEHIVPAWTIGHQRQCWQEGGRKNCSENDAVFQVAEGDLVNLVPAIGEVNGDRSNFPYSAWERNPTPIYGECKTVVDFKLKRAQPREEVRGRIARVFFYMHERYDLSISKQDRQLMCAWAKTYPIDEWETERDQRIAALQGEGNKYVSTPAALSSQCS
ncbi:endonuclease [Chitinimonas sp. BJB300]|uniref:endonuclease n=1 Tax=Chitinimonas sp. BJB300 TaxID=1559339 RepID=UPI000C110E85|nr:endonuclease [Chitinimonas sp. BJB300]PHV12857.1 endonuclease [Chitinimonas sp. BJB300]TSJ86111.1 endonuclease [Chitinimonas sp. BJB300]